LIAAEGFSGVRIHKTVRECIGAFAEFLTSMMAAEAALEKGADEKIRQTLVSRTLVVDELPTLIKLAYTWYRYGLKGKGAPPFLDWLGIILLQGRSSEHYVVVGSQQFANAYFGGTMERAQIGFRITVGQQDRVSWGVAYGQSTPVIGYDSTIKGRGAFSDKRKHPETDHLYVREFQPCYITPEVPDLLAKCAQAPAWHDAGEMAPWITPELLAEVAEIAATGLFLPGGKYGPPLPSDAAVVCSAGAGVQQGPPSSQPVAGDLPHGHATGGATGAAVIEEEDLPEIVSLAEAHMRGILPWKAATTRTYRKRAEARGIPFPEGVTDGQTSYYTQAELLDWLAKWQEWQKAYKAGGGRK
jgi:hypothetical protein